jgi:hypothetical protein
MIKKLGFYLLGYFFTLMMFSSCDYDYINPAPIILPTDSISFKTDIAPVFASRNCTNCHGVGAVAPDLTAANAYSSIMGISGLINKLDPPASVFYLKVTTGSMKDYGMSATEKAFLLKWIEEGANNN